MSPRAQRISLYLVKDGVEELTDVLADDEYDEIELRDDLEFDGVLFVDFDRSRPPPWLSFLREAVAGDLEDHYNVSSAAVLVIKRTYESGDRFFASAFGYGRHMIDDERYVRDFGLKVALNLVDHEELISIDTNTIEEQPFHRRVQASRAAPPWEFQLDAHRDMLRSVTGRPRDDSANRLTGTDAAAVSMRIDVDDLGDLCDKYFELYSSTRYRDGFAWIDQLGQVRDPVLVDDLDGIMVDDLIEGASSAWMAPPELLDWRDLEGFWITGTGTHRRDQVLDEPSLDWYLDGLDRNQLTLMLHG